MSIFENAEFEHEYIIGINPRVLSCRHLSIFPNSAKCTLQTYPTCPIFVGIFSVRMPWRLHLKNTVSIILSDILFFLNTLSEYI